MWYDAKFRHSYFNIKLAYFEILIYNNLALKTVLTTEPVPFFTLGCIKDDSESHIDLCLVDKNDVIIELTWNRYF